MMNNALRQVVNNLPNMSRTYLSTYFVRERGLELPELLLAALRKLPPSGVIRNIDDIEAIEAVSWLIDCVDRSDYRKDEIERRFMDAISRWNKGKFKPKEAMSLVGQLN